jgi:hypothetical protein
MKRLLPILLAASMLATLPMPGNGRNTQDAAQIVGRHTVRITEPPHRIPAPYSVDAPVMGNGYTGVALSGKPERLVFHLARNDFWRLRSGFNEAYPAVLGRLEMTIRGMEDASYEVEQRLVDATTVIRLAKEKCSVECRAYVAATEDVMVVSVKATGKQPVCGKVQLEIRNMME